MSLIPETGLLTNQWAVFTIKHAFTFWQSIFALHYFTESLLKNSQWYEVVSISHSYFWSYEHQKMSSHCFHHIRGHKSATRRKRERNGRNTTSLEHNFYPGQYMTSSKTSVRNYDCHRSLRHTNRHTELHEQINMTSPHPPRVEVEAQGMKSVFVRKIIVNVNLCFL